MNYTHLTQEERYQISASLKLGVAQQDIAAELNRSPSCISRELARNRGLRGYRPKQAQALASARQQSRENSPRIAQATWGFVDEKLAQTWSPEQISGYLKTTSEPDVSHESIYLRIYADKRAGGTLHRALRSQKKYSKRHRGRQRRGTIPNQVSIEQRPAIVASRERFGDWEADLVIGAGQHQALVTINERQSRYCMMAHVPAKTAKNVAEAMISLLTPFAAHVHTLTTDNGKEFTMHEHIAQQLNADFFFAHPYSSWERGANENMNGLIREFFPKKMPFDTICTADTERAMHLLNYRPRKCLGYKTPHEVFMSKLHSRHNAIAL